MVVGVGAGVAAGLVWGLAFLLPEVLGEWSPTAVITGRYVAYGAVSLALVYAGGATLRGVPRRHWRRAAEFAVTGNLGYYLLVVIGVHAVGAPMVTLVVGCIPVAIAVVSNTMSKAYEWRWLAIPLALAATGLLIVNGVEVAGGLRTAPMPISTQLLGLLAAFGALCAWVWYGIANARFLDANPDVSAAHWSTIVGVATGAVTLLGLPIAIVTRQMGPPAGSTYDLAHLIAASIVLGLLVSWGGTWLWNVAATRLSTTVAGLLVVIETIAGLGYVYAARLERPPVSQLVGIALVIGGVLFSMRVRQIERAAQRVDHA